MKPGERGGTIVLETPEEIDLAIESLERTARELADRTAKSMLLAGELLDDAEAPIMIAAEPSKLVLSALESIRSAPTGIGIEAALVYEEYRKKLLK
jgi:hypothetical protein